jgi:hypothetical protein
MCLFVCVRFWCSFICVVFGSGVGFDIRCLGYYYILYIIYYTIIIYYYTYTIIILYIYYTLLFLPLLPLYSSSSPLPNLLLPSQSSIIYPHLFSHLFFLFSSSSFILYLSVLTYTYLYPSIYPPFLFYSTSLILPSNIQE